MTIPLSLIQACDGVSESLSTSIIGITLGMVLVSDEICMLASDSSSTSMNALLITLD